MWIVTQIHNTMAKFKSDFSHSSKQAPLGTPRRELSGPTSHPPSSSPRHSQSNAAFNSQTSPSPGTPLSASLWRPQQADDEFTDPSFRSDASGEDDGTHAEVSRAAGDASFIELAPVQGGGRRGASALGDTNVEDSGQSYRAAMQHVSDILQNHLSSEDGQGHAKPLSGISVDVSGAESRRAEVAEASRHDSRAATGRPPLHSTHASPLAGGAPSPSRSSGHYSKMFSIPKMFQFRWKERKASMSDVLTNQEIDSRNSEGSGRPNGHSKVRDHKKGAYRT